MTPDGKTLNLERLGLGELLSWIMNTAPERPIDRGKSENRKDPRAIG